MPSRFQLVLNQLLEDPPLNPVKETKGKATKGLKVKLLKLLPCQPTCLPTCRPTPGEESGGRADGRTIDGEEAGGSSEQQRAGGGPPKQKRRKNDGKVKIEVTEAQMHGPFNFATHRPEATAAAGSVASSCGASHEPEAQKS